MYQTCPAAHRAGPLLTDVESIAIKHTILSFISLPMPTETTVATPPAADSGDNVTKPMKEPAPSPVEKVDNAKDGGDSGKPKPKPKAKSKPRRSTRSSGSKAGKQQTAAEPSSPNPKTGDDSLLRKQLENLSVTDDTLADGTTREDVSPTPVEANKDKKTAEGDNDIETDDDIPDEATSDDEALSDEDSAAESNKNGDDEVQEDAAEGLGPFVGSSESDSDSGSDSDTVSPQGVRELSKALHKIVKPRRQSRKTRAAISRRIKKANLTGLDPGYLPYKTLRKVLTKPKHLLDTPIWSFLPSRAKPSTADETKPSKSSPTHHSFIELMMALDAWVLCALLCGMAIGPAMSHKMHTLEVASKRAGSGSPTNLQLAVQYDERVRLEGYENLVTYARSLPTIFSAFSTINFPVMTAVINEPQRNATPAYHNHGGGKGKGGRRRNYGNDNGSNKYRYGGGWNGWYYNEQKQGN
ncbi:hypothetical protein FOZ61_002539 [Perkinsus olseni]|uniref:Uncharacterized protein n=1 Tax=Perkinsus olseni TaxID=32597 RepID=A0A7J6KMN2_PEROL|nr:hypothetical protein FOZ61_002539 [Perkinsus olseni]